MWLRLLIDFGGDAAGTVTCAADPVARVLIEGRVAEECEKPKKGKTQCVSDSAAAERN